MGRKLIQLALLLLFSYLLICTAMALSLKQQYLYSPMLLAKNGELISARVSLEQQWKLPLSSRLSEKYVRCILQYEDEHFYFHFGVDPIAIMRAVYLNIKHRKIVSGASTLSMQLVKMLRHKKSSGVWDKFTEMSLAIGLEFLYSKSEIIKFYAQNAPFGSNLIGLESASRMYFQKSINQLSWMEAAMLAVVPNQPSLVGKNKELLTSKATRLLFQLKTKRILTDEQFQLYTLESPDIQKNSLEDKGHHCLNYLIKSYKDSILFYSTIDYSKQVAVQKLVSKHSLKLKENGIENASCIVIDNASGELVSYIGNSMESSKAENFWVDMIQAKRSSGSILKPLLYAGSLDKALISPQSLLLDIPISFHNYSPENFSKKYMGYAPANLCLSKSLNIPFVSLLNEYKVDFFYEELKKLGFRSLFRKADDYGLSLILGGAEVSAWDLATVYSGLVRQYLSDLNNEQKAVYPGRFDVFVHHRNSLNNKYFNSKLFSTGSIYLMIKALITSYEDKEQSVKLGMENLAWKTGTSFGHKDAWCIGMTPKYTIVCWVGNASGLARPGLIGLNTAAPLMFEIVEYLNDHSVWMVPYNELKQIQVCKASGYQKSEMCDEVDSIWTTKMSLDLAHCKWHQTILIDSVSGLRVDYDCGQNHKPIQALILPALAQYFAKQTSGNAFQDYPYSSMCISGHANPLSFIYPLDNADIKLPVDLDEQLNELVLEATHIDADKELFWFYDQNFIGKTRYNHILSHTPTVGKHVYAINDAQGNSAMITINIR